MKVYSNYLIFETKVGFQLFYKDKYKTNIYVVLIENKGVKKDLIKYL